MSVVESSVPPSNEDIWLSTLVLLSVSLSLGVSSDTVLTHHGTSDDVVSEEVVLSVELFHHCDELSCDDTSEGADDGSDDGAEDTLLLDALLDDALLLVVLLEVVFLLSSVSS